MGLVAGPRDRVTVDDVALADAIAVYLDTGDKEWVEASVTIDGTTFDHVGIKLKGNSTLRGITADTDPATIPWLIRLDEYVDGQNYQGTTELVVRANNSETALNEAVGLELVGLAGLATEEAVASRFSVNGGEATLRLTIENPDDEWQAENFTADGILYKAEAEGDWSYRGDDPESYDDVFDQETGDDDLTPLIEFLAFVNDSDDATFAADLSGYLDVGAFATYLAVQDLLRNSDDINGPGNNAYLYYDPATDLMTVVNWDLNLAFSSMAMGGGMPGGQRPEGAPDGSVPEGGLPGMPDGSVPEGFPQMGDGEMPTFADGSVPEGFPQMADGSFPDGGFPGGGQGGGFEQSNVLVDRFLANTEFAALYESKLAELTDAFYTSGAAQQILDTWVATLTEQATDLVAADTITAEAAAIAEQFTAPTTDAADATDPATTTTTA